MRRIGIVTTLAFAVALTGGCATQRQTETAAGAGAGAATGAVIGGITGGGRGAAVGAGVGAAAGAAIGYNWQTIKEKLGIATQGSGVQVSEQSDGSLKLNVPGSISFATASTAIEPRLYSTLDKIAGTLNEYPASTITIVGHTDSVGSGDYNLDLSRRRAAAVADYLAQRNVQRSRMIVDGRGEAEPVADNATESGRAQNRRVEMVVRPAS